jgi:hypothetical protein
MKPFLILISALSLTVVQAQKYGDNHVPVRKDSAVVEAAFPEPNVTLLSPPFQSPSSIPDNFANGSSGPTPDYGMGQWSGSRVIPLLTCG